MIAGAFNVKLSMLLRYINSPGKGRARIFLFKHHWKNKQTLELFPDKFITEKGYYWQDAKNDWLMLLIFLNICLLQSEIFFFLN